MSVEQSIIPIVYRVLRSGVAPCIMFLVILIYQWYRYRKLANNRKKERGVVASKIRNCKLLIGVSLIVVVFTFLLSAYYSLDLVSKDYITMRGEFVGLHRRELGVNQLSFSTDDDIVSVELLHNHPELEYDIESGHEYVFTYAKRSMMVLSIEQSNGDNA